MFPLRLPPDEREEYLTRVCEADPATDAITFLGTPLVLVAAAALAIYVPVRRAMKIDPIVALRYE